MAALKDILAEQSRIKDELQRMETDDEITEEDGGNLRDTLIERWKELDDQARPIILRMEQIKAITRTAADEANLERPGGSDGTSASRFGSPELVISSQRDPYDCQELIRNERQVLITRSELKSRALDAVELEVKRGNLSRDFAEEATAKAQQSAGIARHMLLYGGQEYYDAFRAYCEDPEHLSEVNRAALTLSGGSVMLPFVLDPTIVLTNAGSANPWRRISNVKTTTSNTWNGVSSAGVNAAWLTEGTIVTDGTPSVAAITVTPQKASAWVYGNEKVAA